MSVRTRASGTVLAAKAFGGNEPPGMAQAAAEVSQMTMDHPFAPGEPVGPYDGYSRHTRAFNFTTGYNIATRPRTHERVSFETLRGLIEAYDIASIAIWHRIDSLRSLDWQLTAAENYAGDIKDAAALGAKILRRPDGVQSFESWLAKWLWDVLAYDAGTLSRLRNRAGACVGLGIVDGSSIAPLLDYWGNSPQPPAEAFVQYVNGLPWNWLTRDDLVYEPFRPRANSPYGTAPLESILLNANTDIRFQLFFLQRFTSGNIPEAFASAPETWDPTQIEKFQAEWDAMLYGDTSRKHQIRWMPGGAKITWSNEKDFDDNFSLFLMRKTLSAFHVVPSDLGFTEDVNRSSGDSQADVAHRVGDLPLGRYVQRVLTAFLQDDLGLPLEFAFDWGEEQDDRLNQAESDQIYIQNAVVSASEIREMRFGLAEPEGQVVPRIFFSTREGPIPLNALYGVSGKIDPATAAPDPGTPLPHEVFTTVQGVIPDPPLTATPLAAEEYGPKAIPPAPPMQPQAEPKATDAAHQVAKEGESAPTAGVTSETGVYGYDGPGSDDEDDARIRAGLARAFPKGYVTEEEARQAARDAVAKELAAFRRFEKARVKAGAWRDFRFGAVPKVAAHNLNDGGRLEVRKAAGEIAVAGLAVLAADTGRVLMLQRALCDDDPAGGTWEFPGGHLDGAESPLQAAWREWAEETGAIPPPGALAGTWTSTSGIYQGIVWRVDSESSVPVRCDTAISNPDDPDGDQVEAIAWWDPEQLPGNPAMRPELAADIGAVMDALGCGPDPGPAEVAKAGGSDPKGSWPGWELNKRTVAYWAPLLAAAAAKSLPASQAKTLAAQWLAENPEPVPAGRKREANQAAAGWLTSHGVTFGFADLAAGIAADGYVIGATSASSLTGGSADTDGWQPGDTQDAEAQVAAAGLAVSGADVAGMQAAYLDAAARSLTDSQTAGADPAAAGQALSDAVADPGLAQNVVLNQVVSASAQAAEGVYQSQGIEQVDILNGPNPCAECQALAASNPHAPGLIPAHPACQCAEVVHRE